MKRAVITGATGMLAVATANRLLAEGYEVVCVARPSSSRLSNIPQDDKVTVVELDMARITELPQVLKASGIEGADLFFHFAWDGTHGDSRNDMDIQIVNIKSAVEAVRTAAALGCSSFLGAGSQAEYGRVPDGTALTPDLPCRPENGYGMAKFCAGQMTRVEAEKLNIKHVWVRILSTYGPYDGAHTMVMSAVAGMAEGKVIPFTKGEQMWDYLYSADAAEAFFLAATKGKPSAVYTIGSGRVMQLADYIREIRDIVAPGLELGIGQREYYPGQVMYLAADITNLTEDTGFVPKYTFSEGIKETYEWYRKQM